MRALTKLGKTLAVHPDTKEVDKHSNVTSYLVRLGYSTAVPKIQGAIRRRALRQLGRPFGPPDKAAPKQELQKGNDLDLGSSRQLPLKFDFFAAFCN